MTCDPGMPPDPEGEALVLRKVRVHEGVVVHTGVAHTVSVTPAHASYIGQLPNLLREDDRLVLGGAGFVNDTYKRTAVFTLIGLTNLY